MTNIITFSSFVVPELIVVSALVEPTTNHSAFTLKFCRTGLKNIVTLHLFLPKEED